MTDAASSHDDPAEAQDHDDNDDEELADVSGGAVPEELLEDPEGDGSTRH
jgi:hypothetical protein